MTPDVHSDPGKQMLAHALNSEYCVLEFREQDDGSIQVLDITEHVQRLEENA